MKWLQFQYWPGSVWVGVGVAGRVNRGEIVGHPGLPRRVLPFVVTDDVVAIFGDAINVAEMSLEARRGLVHRLRVPHRRADEALVLRSKHPLVPTPHMPCVV